MIVKRRIIRPCIGESWPGPHEASKAHIAPLFDREDPVRTTLRRGGATGHVDTTFAARNDPIRLFEPKRVAAVACTAITLHPIRCSCWPGLAYEV